MKLLLLTFILISVIFSSCSTTSKESDERIIFVSILPLKYFADKIAGDSYKVEVTVPPGVGPETYSPTPRQMKKLSEADAYFAVGYLGFEEAWLGGLTSTNSLKVFNTSNGISLIKNHEEEEHEGHAHIEGVDPHIWSSPKEAIVIAKNIYEGMASIDPGNREQYSLNLQKVLDEIGKVDSTVTTILSNAPHKKFLIFHPALGYFARAYGLEQLSIEFEGKEPSPKHMQDIIDKSREGNISVVLIQKEFDKRNAEIIANEIGCGIVQIDPLDYNWPEQMISIATKLAGGPE